jgi:hypothetical protein
MKPLLTLLLSLHMVLLGLSQESGSDSLPTNQNISQKIRQDTSFQDVQPEASEQPLHFISHKEFWLGITTLAVLLIILPLLLFLIRKKNINDELSVKLIITIVVIMSTLFLVVSGYDDKTIAPAFGLFGGVLGYIFGRSDSKTS